MAVRFGWRRIASKARHPWLEKGTGLLRYVARIVQYDDQLVLLRWMRFFFLFIRQWPRLPHQGRCLSWFLFP